MPNLEQLNLRFCKQLSNFSPTNCQNIKKLYLRETKISDSTLKQLSTLMPNLEILSISCCKQLNEFQLKNCQKLKILRLSSTKISDQTLKQLSQSLPNLEQLELNQCSQLSKFQLTNCQKLKKFNLSNTKITDLTLTQLSQSMLNLEQLNVGLCSQLSKFKLINCQKLKKLRLSSTIISDQTLKQLTQSMRNLEQLNLYRCKQLSKFQLSNCQKMKKLDLSQTKITEISLSMPNMEYLKLQGCSYLSKFQLSNCQKMKKLDLSDTIISDQTLKQLTQLMPNLEQLNLYRCKQLSKFQLSNCQKMKKLDLSDTIISDQALKQLTQSMRNLEQLNLYRCKQLSKFQLSNCQKIKELDLSFTQISDQALKQLTQSMPNMEYLKLQGCSYLSKFQLPNCQQIKALDLSFTNISDHRVQELSVLYPSLIIYSNFIQKSFKQPLIQKFIPQVTKTISNTSFVKNLQLLLKNCNDKSLLTLIRNIKRNYKQCHKPNDQNNLYQFKQRCIVNESYQQYYLQKLLTQLNFFTLQKDRTKIKWKTKDLKNMLMFNAYIWMLVWKFIKLFFVIEIQNYLQFLNVRKCEQIILQPNIIQVYTFNQKPIDSVAQKQQKEKNQTHNENHRANLAPELQEQNNIQLHQNFQAEEVHSLFFFIYRHDRQQEYSLSSLSSLALSFTDNYIDDLSDNQTKIYNPKEQQECREYLSKQVEHRALKMLEQNKYKYKDKNQNQNLSKKISKEKAYYCSCSCKTTKLSSSNDDEIYASEAIYSLKQYENNRSELFQNQRKYMNSKKQKKRRRNSLDLKNNLLISYQIQIRCKSTGENKQMNNSQEDQEFKNCSNLKLNHLEERINETISQIKQSLKQHHEQFDILSQEDRNSGQLNIQLKVKKLQKLRKQRQLCVKKLERERIEQEQFQMSYLERG